MRLKLILYLTLFFEKARALCKGLFMNLIGLKFSKKQGFRVGSHSVITLYTKKSEMIIGSNCYFRRNCSVIVSDGKLTIGDNFFMNNFSSLNCMGQIDIGNDCLFGEGVKLYDHNYDYRKADGKPFNKKGHRKGFIKIGNNCWLGSNCVVLMNVTIGDNVIIGANTVVYKDVPAGTILVNKQDLQSVAHQGN